MACSAMKITFCCPLLWIGILTLSSFLCGQVYAQAIGIEGACDVNGQLMNILQNTYTKLDNKCGMCAVKEDMNRIQDDLNRVREDLTYDIRRTETELNRAKDEILGTGKEISHIKTLVLNQSDHFSYELREVKEMLQDNVGNMNEKILHTNIQCNKTNGQFDQTKAELDETKNELQMSKAELNETRKELQTTQGMVSSLRTQLNTQSDTMKITENELNDTREELQFVKVMMQNLSAQVAALQKTVLEYEKYNYHECADLYKSGKRYNGIYQIYPTGYQGGIFVFCDMTTDGGGWTVFQKRLDGSEDFYRGWEDYKNGFGNLSGEFWLGNDYIHRLTNQANYELRVDLEDTTGGTVYAKYDSFAISAETDNYRLSLGSYSGNAGDSLAAHSGHTFSTKDRDNDKNDSGSCAVLYKGAWWYFGCHGSNLNGLYHLGQHDTYADGINWSDYKGNHYSLRRTEMKIRRKDF